MRAFALMMIFRSTKLFSRIVFECRLEMFCEGRVKLEGCFRRVHPTDDNWHDDLQVVKTEQKQVVEYVGEEGSSRE